MNHVICIEKIDFRREGKEILAVFPERVEDPSGNILCYGHEGNHSVCSVGYYTKLKKAKPFEYKWMKRELESIGYELQVI